MGQTIKEAFERSGVGLHSGKVMRLKVSPAEDGKGRYFVRTDLPEKPQIPATVASVCQTTLSTELGVGDAKIRTVEHLLAALAASGVEDACLEIDGPEIPLLDGSAKNWVEAIAQAGLTLSTTNNELKTQHCQLQTPLWIRDGDAFVAALPASQLRFTYGIDFELPAIGNQWYSWTPEAEPFQEAIAPARTFGLSHQIEQLQKAGLIQGGSLENALVCSDRGWINPPLRFPNEPVRHKLLDLVGDLSLLGTFPQAHFLAYKASHRLHIQLARTLAHGRDSRMIQ